MDKTPDIIIYNIKTNNTETDFRRFIKELELGSPIAILNLKASNRSNQDTSNWQRQIITSISWKTMLKKQPNEQTIKK